MCQFTGMDKLRIFQIVTDTHAYDCKEENGSASDYTYLER